MESNLYNGTVKPLAIAKSNNPARMYVGTDDKKARSSSVTGSFAIMDSVTLPYDVKKLIAVGTTNRLVVLTVTKLHYVSLEPASVIN